MNMKFASRKFIISMTLIVCTAVLGAYGKIESGGITLVFGFVGAGYGLANVMDKKRGSEG